MLPHFQQFPRHLSRLLHPFHLIQTQTCLYQTANKKINKTEIKWPLTDSTYVVPTSPDMRSKQNSFVAFASRQIKAAVISGLGFCITFRVNFGMLGILRAETPFGYEIIPTSNSPWLYPTTDDKSQNRFYTNDAFRS